MAVKARVALPTSDDLKGALVPRELTRQEFGRRLFQLMTDKDWSQSELGRQADVGRDAISTYVNGKTFPTPRNLRRLAKALGVSEEELLPNQFKKALEDEFPALEIKAAAGHPDKAWLRINRAVPFSVAAKIAQIINEADEADRLAKK